MLLLITVIGILLRLSFIIKPEGLWNDEYVSWHVASTPFFNGFWEEVLKQCHMPLYYLYLKPFANCSDTVLRLTSVLPGVLAIPVMFLVGKEYSKKIGYFAAIITSFLSFLIYYSQEVRFYSLLFLFSALSLLYTIRYIKNDNKKNQIAYIISLFLILCTHILGSIYVFFSLILVISRKKKLPSSLKFVIAGFVLFILFALSFTKMLPSSQWWGHFSYTNILFLFSDYLSPILTNNVNAPPVFFYNKSYALWLLFPTLIGLFAIINGVRKGLMFIVLSTIISMSLLALCGKIVFITKYSIEILPILILFAAIGFSKIKKGGILLVIFILFHSFSFFTPNYVTKIKRTEGHKIVGDILNYQQAQNVIFTYYEPDRFHRYADLSKQKVYFISKINRFDYLDNPARILNNIPIGESVSLVILDSVSFFDDKYLYDNRNNAQIPEMFISFSMIKNSLLKRLDKDFKDYKVARGGAWTVIKAVRYK